MQKNIACHQKLWYYENEKVSIVGTCPAERRYPMNVTVADCLKLPTLREAQLIAGAKGTDRAVSSVSVLEWPETNLLSDELIVGNELVISALVTIKDDVSRQCSVLRHLRSMGAAGLVLFYVGVFIPQIDDALIAVADEITSRCCHALWPHGLPILGYDHGYSRVYPQAANAGQLLYRRGDEQHCAFGAAAAEHQYRLASAVRPHALHLAVDRSIFGAKRGSGVACFQSVELSFVAADGSKAEAAAERSAADGIGWAQL